MSTVCFLVGTGRCGSTLAHELLARHPDVGFVTNVADRVPAAGVLSRYGNPLYRRVPQPLTRKGRVRLAPSEAYRLLTARVSPALSRPSRDLLAEDATPWLRGRLSTFVLEEAARQRRPVFTHKLTGWPRTGLLLEVFPAARVVHVVRDGRAVANSLLQMPWWGGYAGPQTWRYGPLPADYDELWQRSGRSYVVLAGLTWRLLMDAYDRAEQAAPAAQWLTVRYEDLVAAPREQLARILSFVGLTWTRAFERGFARSSVTGGRSAAYCRDLSPAQLQQLEQVLGPAMTRHGYRPVEDGAAGLGAAGAGAARSATSSSVPHRAAVILPPVRHDTDRGSA